MESLSFVEGLSNTRRPYLIEQLVITEKQEQIYFEINGSSNLSNVRKRVFFTHQLEGVKCQDARKDAIFFYDMIAKANIRFVIYT